MEDKFYAKGNGNNGYIKNLEVCSFNNLDELVECFKWLCTKEMKNTIYMDAVLEEIKKME